MTVLIPLLIVLPQGWCHWRGKGAALRLLVLTLCAAFCGALMWAALPQPAPPSIAGETYHVRTLHAHHIGSLCLPLALAALVYCPARITPPMWIRLTSILVGLLATGVALLLMRLTYAINNMPRRYVDYEAFAQTNHTLGLAAQLLSEPSWIALMLIGLTGIFIRINRWSKSS